MPSQKVVDLVTQARERVATAVNIAEVYTKFHIGQYIVEYEQKGERRAEYGKAVLKDLSKRLTERFGDGWGYSNLRQIRQFYITYSDLTNSVCQIQDKKDKQCLANSKKVHSVDPISEKNKNGNHCLSDSVPAFTLSWSHYIILMRIADPMARSFYEIECRQQDWSVRQLSRQVASSLYERLALSRNKDEVMQLAQKGQTMMDTKALRQKIRDLAIHGKFNPIVDF